VGCAAGLAMVELMEGGLLARGVALGNYMGASLEVSSELVASCINMQRTSL
jgi:hypothetical protein